MQTNVKSSVVAGILGVFLGAFGGHDWYLGNTKKAITHVCLCVGGLILLMLSLILASIFDGITALRLLSVCIEAAAFVIILGNGIWGFIEGVIIIAQGDPGLAAKGYKVAVPASTTMQMSVPTVANGDAVVPTANVQTNAQSASVVASEQNNVGVAGSVSAGTGSSEGTQTPGANGTVTSGAEGVATGSGQGTPASGADGVATEVKEAKKVESAPETKPEPITPAPANPNVITANPAADSVMQATMPVNTEAKVATAEAGASATMTVEPATSGAGEASKVTPAPSTDMKADVAKPAQEATVTQAIADPTVAETATVDTSEVKTVTEPEGEKKSLVA